MPGRDRPEGASAWELRGFPVGRPCGRSQIKLAVEPLPDHEISVSEVSCQISSAHKAALYPHHGADGT